MKFRNILLVDDDPDDQEIFRVALNECNVSLNFEGFCDPLKALNKLSEKYILPDAIFLDLNMPVMSGFQFLAHIRSQELLKNIPVFIYSTSSQATTIRRAKELGANDFITKPNKIKDLIDTLRSILI